MGEEKITCTVEMDGKTTTSDDFVAILSKENGDASIFYNTDALTLGMAMKMVARAFVECMDKCPEKEREEITEILGAAFVADKPAEEE
jgi:hypothetical protein